jgi:hypothetical protein
LNSFGTVLTPMMPVGLSALTASTKVEIGAWPRAKRLLEVRQIGARRDRQAIDIEQRLAASRLAYIHAVHRHG